ncbi:MAG: hypothetical protein V2A73_03480 [Pseudomonadota bacterium]
MALPALRVRMMSLRISVLDAGAACVTLVAILLPQPSRPITPVFSNQAASYHIACAQAELQLQPDSGRATKAFCDRLLGAGQTDVALRVAGTALERPALAERWQALLAVGEAHLQRAEILAAFEWTEKALAACRQDGGSCSSDDLVRLETLATALEAGVDSGIDPRLNPEAFDRAVRRRIPIIRMQP